MFSADLRHLQDIDSADSKGDVEKKLLSESAKPKKSKSTSKLETAHTDSSAKSVSSKSTSQLPVVKEEIKMEEVADIKPEPQDLLLDMKPTRPSRKSRSKTDLAQVSNGSTETQSKRKKRT